MIEAYLPFDRTETVEKILQDIVLENGGRITFVEKEEPSPRKGSCLTIEFARTEQAETAATQIRQLGYHVEGPADY